MRFGHIDIPRELLEAQQRGDLVLFAGAGVSCAAGLPNFEKLAEAIAQGTGIQLEEAEKPDRFLGRLKEARIEVHQRAVDILKNQRPKTLECHADLLRLFRSIDCIRVVTTNYDLFFNEAGETPSALPTYRAPALPLGHDFQGVVYLHGSLGGAPNNLVMTDADFSRAYLTEGWARRFLLGATQGYALLFVGYSHEDTILEYLARGLPADSKQKRFALVSSDRDLGWWRRLRVEPILYPRDGDDYHEKLWNGIHRWADHNSRGALETEQQIHALATGMPPSDPEDIDFLHESLRDAVRLKAFTRKAEGAQWLTWVSDQGLLDPLFSGGEAGDAGWALAQWIAETYVGGEDDAVLAIQARKGGTLNKYLWHSILNRLVYVQAPPSPQTLSRWVPIISKDIPADLFHPFGLIELLKKCLIGGAEAAGLALFSRIAQPSVHLERCFDFLDEGKTPRARIEIHLPLVEHPSLFEEIWRTSMSPKLDTLGCSLWRIAIGHLTTAYELLRAADGCDPYFDVISFRRQGIEPNEQDKLSESLDFLIDTTRNLLEWANVARPTTARRWVEDLSASEHALLVRLAVYGLRLAPWSSPKEKLNFLEEYGWLSNRHLRHEIYHLLKALYLGLDKSERLHLIQQIEDASPWTGVEDEEEREHRAYETYTKLHWLSISSPEDEALRARLEVIQREFPSFKPRENPDHERWSSSGWCTPRSPIGVSELVAMEFSKAANFLLEHLENQEGMSAVIHAAVSQTPNWGIGLAKAFLANREWTVSYWEPILWALRECSLSADDWGDILSLLQEPQLHAAHAHGISSLLKRAVESPGGVLPPPLQAESKKLARLVWEALPDENYKSDPEDWLQEAINDPGGHLALFWIGSLSNEIQQRNGGDVGLPEEYREVFFKVIHAPGRKGGLGRVALASNAAFLYHVDPSWTREHLLPLFNWDRDSLRARQAWDGLGWSRMSEALAMEMKRLFQDAFPHFAPANERRTENLARHVAVIAVLFFDNPLADGWLPSFIREIGENGCVQFAHFVNEILETLGDEQKAALWLRWLESYWIDRNQGVPIPISTSECTAILNWTMNLTVVLPNAVACACRSPKPEFQPFRLFYDLDRSSLPENQPDPVTKLLVGLTQYEGIPGYVLDGLRDVPMRLINARAGRALCKVLLENLGRLGHPRALEWKGVLDQRGDNGSS